jgi:hypothetical protein
VHSISKSGMAWVCAVLPPAQYLFWYVHMFIACLQTLLVSMVCSCKGCWSTTLLWALCTDAKYKRTAPLHPCVHAAARPFSTSVASDSVNQQIYTASLSPLCVHCFAGTTSSRILRGVHVPFWE